jgi:hypothetical protein
LWNYVLGLNFDVNPAQIVIGFVEKRRFDGHKNLNSYELRRDWVKDDDASARFRIKQIQATIQGKFK